MKVSLIIPVYNEQEILGEVLEKYKADLKNIAAKTNGTYEIIAINDGCSDASGDVLSAQAKLNRHLRVINFAGRWGKQAAITAGFEVADGDVVILADVDLLNPVGILEKVVEEYMAGHNIVYAYRDSIGRESMKHNLSEKLVGFATRIFGIEGIYTGKANVMLYSRTVADVIASLPNRNKLLRTMDNWVGWDVHPIAYASGYNKSEIREKTQSAKRHARRSGMKRCPRSNVREHTTSRQFSLLAAIIAVFFTIGWIIAAEPWNFGLLAHTVAMITLLAIIGTSMLFYLRAMMIKRIGVVHRDEGEVIYRVENVIN